MRLQALAAMLPVTLLVASCADLCASSADCAAEEYCSIVDPETQCNPDGTCHRVGTCEDRRKEGERCDEPDSCVSGLECAGTCRVPPPPPSDFMACDAAGPGAVGATTLLFGLVGVAAAAISRRRHRRSETRGAGSSTPRPER